MSVKRCIKKAVDLKVEIMMLQEKKGHSIDLDMAFLAADLSWKHLTMMEAGK